MRNGSACVPLIGVELQYLDWRHVTDIAPAALPVHDFAEPAVILSDAWNRTVTYIQSSNANPLQTVSGFRNSTY